MLETKSSLERGIPLPTYIIDPESAAAISLLLNQSRLQTFHMGGLLPEQVDPSIFHDALDIGCGPAAWACDLAFANPEMRVVGIDPSASMIEFAGLMARELGLANASFAQLDPLRPLAFPDASFDLINAKQVVEWLPRGGWLPFLHECRRLLRPGGVLRLTEYELGFSNSPMHERLYGLLLRAMQVQDRLFSPDGRHLGIINMLQPLLRKAGLHSPDEHYRRLYSIDYSAGTDIHAEWCQDMLLHLRLTLPFIVASGVATRHELEQGCARLQEEVFASSFAGFCLYMTAWGSKQMHGSFDSDNWNRPFSLYGL